MSTPYYAPQQVPQVQQVPTQQYQVPPAQYQVPPAQYQVPPTQYQQAPVAPAVTGTLDQFYSQPSSAGGPSLKFNGRPIGTEYVGVVARRITNSDVRAQTDQSGRVMTYRDGRPKFVLVIPLLVMPSPEYPEGRATLWVKGQMRDELAQAMAKAGVPEGTPPEEGATIRVKLKGLEQIPGLNPRHVYEIEYTRPQGAEAAQQVAQSEPAPAPAAPATPAVNPQTQVPAEAMAGLTPDQQELVNRLIQQQQASS